MTEKERLEQRRSQLLKNCKWCGTEFSPKRKTKEYCSDKCRAHYNIHKNENHYSEDKKVEMPSPNNEANSPVIDDSHLQGLKGVVEDSNSSIVQKKENTGALNNLKSEISTTIAALNRAVTEYNEKVSIKGVGIIGGFLGVMLTGKDASLQRYVLGGALGVAGGIIGQKLVNEHLENRRVKLKKYIRILRAKIASLYEKEKRLSLARPKPIEFSDSFFDSLLKTEKPKPQVIKAAPIEPSKKMVSSSELIRMSFKSLDFKGRWKELVGSPAITFHMVIHGAPGQGKSTFSLLFADYLAKNFGNVLYASSEEGHNKTMKDKCVLNKMDNPNLIIGDFRTPQEILEEVKPNQFHFIVIDSLNDLGMGIDELKEFREVYSNSALITVSQSTKNGQIRGSQQIVHDCDIEIRVNQGIAKANKNRFGRIGYEFEIF